MDVKKVGEKILSSFYNQIDSKIEVFLNLDGKKYEIANFQIVFGQPSDFKGQPQQEVKGGQFLLTLTQTLDDSVYIWAKKANSIKSGTISFVTETEGTKLEIIFTDASCISLVHKVNAFSGLEIMMVVSPAMLSINGVLHDNKWRLE